MSSNFSMSYVSYLHGCTPEQQKERLDWYKTNQPDRLAQLNKKASTVSSETLAIEKGSSSPVSADKKVENSSNTK